MTTPQTVTVTSTSQLDAAGLAGYRKAIGAFLTVVIALVAQAWADGSITSAEWGTIALGSASAAVAAFLLPNAVKQVEVAVPPTPADHVDADTYGDHAADRPKQL